MCMCARVQQEGLIEKLFSWAREAERPLCVYSTGLLASAMSDQEVAACYREQNSQLVGLTHTHTHTVCSVTWSECGHVSCLRPGARHDSAPA